MRYRSFIALCSIALCVADVQAQQPSDTALFGGLVFRNVGPNRGGRSQAVAGSAARPFEYYFGATGGGVWKTTDGGTTWRAVSDKDFTSSSVGALSVCEANPDVVYAGMGETELRGNIMQGDGVYKSTNAGTAWTKAGLENSQAIARVRVQPTNCDVAYAAVLGRTYGASPDRGVYKTTDGGKTWTKVLYRDDKTGAVDLAMDPGNPDVLYAGMWQAHRTPWSLSSGGPGRALTEIVSTRSSRRVLAASSAPTMAVPPGRAPTRSASCASARSTTRASMRTRKRRTWSTF